ncbi:MAG: hypothetical protein IPI66_12865 [Chitinophagaceae bacterium]|nr:hypothetical protein [Chitinophagaceae bacterium]
MQTEILFCKIGGKIPCPGEGITGLIFAYRMERISTLKHEKNLLIRVLLAICSTAAFSQYNINAAATNYTEDFNTLTNGTWTDNTTLTGWYARLMQSATIAAVELSQGGTGSTVTAGHLCFWQLPVLIRFTDRGLGYVATMHQVQWLILQLIWKPGGGRWD